MMVKPLLVVQELDAEIADVERELNILLPKRLSEAEVKEQGCKKALEDTQASLRVLEMEHRDMEGTLRLEEERVKKSKKKVGELKKDYEIRAMQREVDVTRRANEELEEKILEKLGAIEIMKQSLGALTASWEAANGELESVRTEVSGKMQEYKRALETQYEARKLAEAEVDRNLLARYRRVRSRQSGAVLVRIDGYSCRGCHLNLPPQMVNEMQRHSTVESCPHCHRLLYYEVETPAA